MRGQSGWLWSVLMLAAAGLLFWAPWNHPAGGVLGAFAADSVATGEAPSDAAGAQTGAAADTAAPGRLVTGPIIPARLTIPAIGVSASVESHGTVRTKNVFTGKMVDAYGVPSSMRTTSWWSDGPQPGSGKMAVILGHTQVGGYGVFNDLGKLHDGAPLTLRAANGDTLQLRVLGSPVTGLDKSTSALADALTRHPPGAAVAFVTCGGQFDQKADASKDNVVVFASVVPAG